MDELEQRVAARLQARGIDINDLDPESYRGFVNGVRNSLNENRLASGNLPPGQQDRLGRLGIWPDGKMRTHEEEPDEGKIRGRDVLGAVVSPLSLLMAKDKSGQVLEDQPSILPINADKNARTSVGQFPQELKQAATGVALANPIGATAAGIYGMGKGLLQEARDPGAVTPRDVFNTAAQGVGTLAGLVPGALRTGTFGRGFTGRATPQARAAKLVSDIRPQEAGIRSAPETPMRRAGDINPDALRGVPDAALGQTPPIGQSNMAPGAQEAQIRQVIDGLLYGRRAGDVPNERPLGPRPPINPADINVKSPFEEGAVPQGKPPLPAGQFQPQPLDAALSELGLDEARAIAKGDAPEQGAGFRALEQARSRKLNVGTPEDLTRSLNAASRQAAATGRGKSARRYRGNEDTGGQPE